MSWEEDYLMAEMRKLKQRMDAVEAIVTGPHGDRGQTADVSGFDAEPGTDTLSTDESGAEEAPAERECDKCGETVRVRKDGSLYKHPCSEDDDGSG